MESLDIQPSQARREGRPEAAALCFDWQQESPLQENEMSEANHLRKHGLRQTIITATLAALLYFFLSEQVGKIVGGVACVLFVSSMLFPVVIYARIEALVGFIANRLQRGVTWLLMRMIFSLFFTPFSLLFRRGQRDKLTRWLEPESDTYWNDRTEPITPESRLRLY